MADRVARPTGRPVIPRMVDEDPDHVTVRAGGQLARAPLVALEEYDMNRLKAGYICIQCLEDLDISLPTQCPICKFPMAERQQEKLMKEYVGNVRVGPSTTLEEEREIMIELRKKEAVDAGRMWTPSIVVPRGL